MTGTRRRITMAAAAALVVPLVAAAPPAGGWAVVSVLEVPHAWVTGRPFELVWETRGHGTSPIPGLTPRIEARSGDRVLRGLAWAGTEDRGRTYRGRFTFPAAGDWQITIHSGFGRGATVLLPVPVVDAARASGTTVAAQLASLGVAPPSPAEAGRRTFVARGCVTCHANAAVAVRGEMQDFGPELTGRRWPAEYLGAFLKDPSIGPGRDGKRMPNLELREQEIALLVAFLNADARQARR